MNRNKEVGEQEIAENRLVFNLSFRLREQETPDDSEELEPAARLAKELNALSDERLLKRWASEGTPGALWAKQDHAQALGALSTELYPVAGRILYGEAADTGQCRAPLQSIARGGGRYRKPLGDAEAEAGAQFAAWMLGATLSLRLPDTFLHLQFQGASMRLFGSGIGLMSLSIRVGLPNALDPTVPARELLNALHVLTQNDVRGNRPLSSQARWSWRHFAGAASKDTLFIERDGRLEVIQINGYERACKAAGARLPLWRCVATRAANSAPQPDAEGRLQVEPPQIAIADELPLPACEVLLEQLVPERVVVLVSAKGAGRQITKNQRFVQAPGGHAGGAREQAGLPSIGTSSAEGPIEETPIAVIAFGKEVDAEVAQAPGNGSVIGSIFQALHNAKAGEPFWAYRLPPDFSLCELMRDFLPPSARPARDVPLNDLSDHHWHAFSHAAVRIRDESGVVAPPDVCREFAFRLSRRFNLSYKPSAAEMSPATVEPFETVFHSVGTQGAGLVVRDDGTEFLQNFLSRAFVTAYRPLAEICLHEYALLLDLVQESAFQPARQATSEDIDRLERLGDELARYRLYYRFSKISHMAHHNSVLALWRRALGLDMMLSEVEQDVAQAHRLLDGVKTRSEARRWSIFTSVGLAMAAFLSTSEGFDRWAQFSCPPEALSMATTDLQLHGAPEHLLDILGALRKSQPGEPQGWVPLLDRACAADWVNGPPAIAASPAASSTPESALPPTASLTGDVALDHVLQTKPSGTADGPTWAAALRNFCGATAEARACAHRASQRRVWGMWWSLIAAGGTFALALLFLPGAVGAKWVLSIRRKPRQT